MNTRKKKLILNSISSLIYQLAVFASGLVLPRMFLRYYGSEVNGLVTSIGQFLGVIMLAECGVGSVVQSALYKPLAEQDEDAVSRIMISSERFFRKIALILAGYTALLVAAYPLLTLETFDYGYTMLLILLISIRYFAQYYFGMSYKLLFLADQRGYIQYTLHAGAHILNTLLCVLLMQRGASVHLVKFATSFVFLLQPLSLMLIARKRYRIDRSLVLTEEPLKQKWNGVAQHLALVAQENTDTIILTLFATLTDVSIYDVYHLVVVGIKQIIVSFSDGMQAMLGNMYARNETETLNRTFDGIEWLLHFIVTVVFSAAAMLILPFIGIYTRDIADANYYVPTFAYMITLAMGVYCLRLPYYMMVLVAGHYKQTQMSAVLEAAINIVVSTVLVFRYGIIGVAIGTFVAMAYRTGYLVWYLSGNILNRSVRHFLSHGAVDALTAICIIALVRALPGFFTLRGESYGAWIALALKVTACAAAVGLAVNAACYRSKAVAALRMIVQKFKKKR